MARVLRCACGAAGSLRDPRPRPGVLLRCSYGACYADLLTMSTWRVLRRCSLRRCEPRHRPRRRRRERPRRVGRVRPGAYPRCCYGPPQRRVRGCPRWAERHSQRDGEKRPSSEAPARRRSRRRTSPTRFDVRSSACSASTSASTPPRQRTAFAGGIARSAALATCASRRPCAWLVSTLRARGNERRSKPPGHRW